MLPQAVALLGILIGTATDLKKREVPDWVNYGMMLVGISYGIIFSVVQGSFLPIIASLLGLGIGYLVGAAMYYTGQWGGGDSKLIMGVGALLSIPWNPFTWVGIPEFILFLILSIFAGAAYGMAWMVGLLIYHRKKVFKRFTEKMHSEKLVRIRKILLVSCVLIVAIALFLPLAFRVLLITLAAITYVTFYLFLIAKSIEEVAYIKKRSVKDLVEGDWIVGEIKSGKKVLVKESSTGITKKELTTLQKSKIKEVTIKEGIPFVPSFLFALLLTWWWMSQEISLIGLLF